MGRIVADLRPLNFLVIGVAGLSQEIYRRSMSNQSPAGRLAGEKRGQVRALRFVEPDIQRGYGFFQVGNVSRPDHDAGNGWVFESSPS